MTHSETQHGPEGSARESGESGANLAFTADTKRAMIGGGVTAGIALIGMLIVNVSSGSEARFLLQGMLPSLRFLCSAVMTATATILALMLTLLSFSNTQSRQLKSLHYDRVRQIAQVNSATFAAALVLLLLFSIPLAEASEVPANWYTVLYYIAVLYTASLGGALITVILMLYNAITDLIGVIHPDERSHLPVDGS